MTPTESLRLLLDERGVPWVTHGNTDRVWWTSENGSAWYAQDRPSVNGLFVKLEAVVTPVQAIEVLGRGECEIETKENWLPAEQYHRCKHCGAFFAVMDASGDIPPCVCPNCGKAVKR